MVHTAIRRSHIDVRNSGLIGSHSHPTPTVRQVAQDWRNETALWSLSTSDVNRVNSLRWREQLVHDAGYIWPQHLKGERARVRYSTEHVPTTSAKGSARGRRWEETYVERCLAELGKSATTLDEARRCQVIRSLLDHMAAAPLDRTTI